MDNQGGEKSLRDRMKGSLDTIRTTVKNAKKPEVKVPDLKELEQKVLDLKVPDLKIPPVMDLLKKKEEAPAEEESVLTITSVSTKSALKVFYFLMAVDGKLAEEEEAKFDLLGREIAPEYDSLKDQVVTECRAQMEKMIDPDDYYDVIQDGVENALTTSVRNDDSFITPKLLVWDLLTIAYSEGQYDEQERKLLKYVVRKLNIDKAVFLEMESSIQTLLDLEKEQQWLKTTDRQYLTIEGMVNEIEDRKHVIFDSVKVLISL